MSEWKPIETAPRDGTPILVFDVSPHYGSEPRGCTIMVVRFTAFHPSDYRAPGGYWDAPYGPCRADDPRHWMPLPAPPLESFETNEG